MIGFRLEVSNLQKKRLDDEVVTAREMREIVHTEMNSFFTQFKE